MKLSLSSPVVLVLDPPKRVGHVVAVVDLRPGDAAAAPRAVLSGKRAHRALRLEDRSRAYASRLKTVA